MQDQAEEILSDDSMCVLSSSTGGITHLWDLGTRALLSSYKDNNSKENCTTLLESPTARCDYFVTCQKSKPSLFIYTWTRDAAVFKCALLEPLESCTSTHDGKLFIGGSSTGKCYIWNILTGELIRVWSAHYRCITSIATSPDSKFIASGGKDGIIHLWSIEQLFSPESLRDQSSPPPPSFTFSDSSLSINKLVYYSAADGRSRLISGSSDRTVRIYQVQPPGQELCLVKMSFPSEISSLALDHHSVQLFVGCFDGKLFVIDIEAASVVQNHPNAVMGRLGPQNTLFQAMNHSQLVQRSQVSNSNMYLGHTTVVTSLQVSPENKLLVSGSNDGLVIVWDIPNKVKIVQYEGHLKQPIFSVLLVKRPPHFQSKLTLFPLVPFKKHQLPKPIGWDYSKLMLECEPRGEKSEVPKKEVSNDSKYLNLEETISKQQATIQALQEKVQSLQAENERWKNVNNKLLQQLTVEHPSKKAKVSTASS
jgi:WD40 repeat protein